MDNERAPKPSRSESEERRRRCALMYDFEVEVSTRTDVGGGGQGPERDRGANGRQPPLTNYRILGIDESSSSAHRPVPTSEKPNSRKLDSSILQAWFAY
jgi:hypothetical protein